MTKPLTIIQLTTTKLYKDFLFWREMRSYTMKLYNKHIDIKLYIKKMKSLSKHAYKSSLNVVKDIFININLSERP